MSFLTGINVLEWGEALTAPLCGKVLADLGADVMKIEPPGGEPGRSLPPFKTGPDGVRRSLLFEHLNAGKRSVTIEADDPASTGWPRGPTSSSKGISTTTPPSRTP